jgi:hypothetical protein
MFLRIDRLQIELPVDKPLSGLGLPFLAFGAPGFESPGSTQ